jgi:hypothetical protein
VTKPTKEEDENAGEDEDEEEDEEEEVEEEEDEEDEYDALEDEGGSSKKARSSRAKKGAAAKSKAKPKAYVLCTLLCAASSCLLCAPSLPSLPLSDTTAWLHATTAMPVTAEQCRQGPRCAGSSYGDPARAHEALVAPGDQATPIRRTGQRCPFLLLSSLRLVTLKLT